MSRLVRYSMLRLTGLLLMFVAVALLAASCGDNPGTHVAAALNEAALGEIDTEWKPDEEALILKGTVDDATERETAEAIATNALAGDGRVINDLAVAGDEEPLNAHDGEILVSLESLVERYPTLRDRHVRFHVLNGVVTITGQVDRPEEKTQVDEIARRVNGVRDVANAIEVR